MHGFDQHAGYGAGSFGSMGGGPREEVVNNYYGDASPEHHGGDLSDRFAAAGDSPSPDIEDRRGFADDTSDQADVGVDDTTDNFADDSSDDSGSYDDGGGSDDSSF